MYVLGSRGYPFLYSIYTPAQSASSSDLWLYATNCVILYIYIYTKAARIWRRRLRRRDRYESVSRAQVWFTERELLAQMCVYVLYIRGCERRKWILELLFFFFFFGFWNDWPDFDGGLCSQLARCVINLTQTPIRIYSCFVIIAIRQCIPAQMKVKLNFTFCNKLWHFSPVCWNGFAN